VSLKVQTKNRACPCHGIQAGCRTCEKFLFCGTDATFTSNDELWVAQTISEWKQDSELKFFKLCREEPESKMDFTYVRYVISNISQIFITSHTVLYNIAHGYNVKKRCPSARIDIFIRYVMM